MLPSFLIEDEFLITGHGIAYVVTLDRECDDFNWLLKEQVLLDGELFLVNGVEHFAHSPPWRVGEKIGLLVSVVDPTNVRMIGNPIFDRLPERFRWTIHNIVGHPLSEVFFQIGFFALSNWAHDWTIPLHDSTQGGRG